jgi:hypothetical protein
MNLEIDDDEFPSLESLPRNRGGLGWEKIVYNQMKYITNIIL